jgi:hypothetical protein
VYDDKDGRFSKRDTTRILAELCLWVLRAERVGWKVGVDGVIRLVSECFHGT